jgi:cell wall-associated NlpC family hydrolase
VPSKAQLSGVGLAITATGAYLVYAGVEDVAPLDGIRQLLSGKLPQGQPQKVTKVDYSSASVSDAATSAGIAVGAATGQLNAQIAQAARQYADKGIMYKFGGSQNPNVGFDCSGLVNWCLGHDLGLTLPGNSTPGFSGQDHGPVTQQYYVWSGATTVDPKAIQPGDLVCWTGHIGIASGAGKFVAAPTFGRQVTQEPIWWTPAPLIRRVKSQAGTGAEKVAHG